MSQEMERPADAPACFAAASVFSHDSTVCRGCHQFENCATASLRTLEAIKGVINVEDLIRRHEKAKRATAKAVAPSLAANKPLPAKVERKTQMVKVQFEVDKKEGDVIATLPVKPQEIAIRLCKEGKLNEIRKGLDENRNALAESGPQFLRVAVDHLLAGGFTRKELREAFKAELGWGDSTAASHVSMTLALFRSFRIAQAVEDRFVLVPATVCENND